MGRSVGGEDGGCFRLEVAFWSMGRARAGARNVVEMEIGMGERERAPARGRMEVRERGRDGRVKEIGRDRAGVAKVVQRRR